MKVNATRHACGCAVSVIIDIPPPPRPPFDIETFEPIEPPWQAIKEWIPDDGSHCKGPKEV